MPSKGQKLRYSNRRGNSKYPVDSQKLIRLLKLRRHYNIKLKKYTNHDTYLWIQSKVRLRPDFDPLTTHIPGHRGKIPPHQDKFVTTLIFVPKSDNPREREKYISIRRQMQRGSLVRTMRICGFFEIPGQYPFDSGDKCWKRVLNAIGIS
jgi:hypothetical protein